MTPAKPNPPRRTIVQPPPSPPPRPPRTIAVTNPVPPRPTPAPRPQPKPVPAPNPKSARAFNQQQQFAEMMPDLANRSPAYKRGGGVKSGGSVSKRADGCAQRGKTKGRMI